MKRLTSIVFSVVLLLVYNSLKAQDALPKFNIQDINDNKILITWTSVFGDSCTQLAVQRSFDSTHFFSTIYSAQSPELPQNGVVDLRMPKGVKVFYRIFYVLKGGNYFFTKSIGLYSFMDNKGNKSIFENTTDHPKIDKSREIGNKTEEPIFHDNQQATEVKRYVNVFRRTTDTLYKQMDYKEFIHLRDSIILKTKDTIYTIDENNTIIKPFIAKPSWKASSFVFSNVANNKVNLHLPSPRLHRYRIVFFEENGTQLFEIKPKEDNLILDNANFLHGGWFYFDLYEDDKLKEHNKFQILIPF
jgi:hypothetical protein